MFVILKQELSLAYFEKKKGVGRIVYEVRITNPIKYCGELVSTNFIGDKIVRIPTFGPPHSNKPLIDTCLRGFLYIILYFII